VKTIRKKVTQQQQVGLDHQHMLHQAHTLNSTTHGPLGLEHQHAPKLKTSQATTTTDEIKPNHGLY
jgi:hypothetical protein